MMPWKLWLDDQVNDPGAPLRHVPEGFVGAATAEQARELVRQFGPPSYMDLDHDLGDGEDAKGFLQWLWANYPDDPPDDFRIHSANMCGAAQLESYLTSWKRSLDL